MGIKNRSALASEDSVSSEKQANGNKNEVEEGAPKKQSAVVSEDGLSLQKQAKGKKEEREKGTPKKRSASVSEDSVSSQKQRKIIASSEAQQRTIQSFFSKAV